MTRYNNKTMLEQIIAVSLLLAVIGSAFFFIEAGYTDTYEILTGDETNVSAATVTVFGGSIDTMDRMSVGIMLLTIVTALGWVAIDKDQPDLMNQMIMYAPIIGAVVGLVEFGSIVQDILERSYDWSANSDMANGLHLAVLGWVVGGIVTAYHQFTE